MNEVKALILCNNPIAIPGIREFLFFGKVGAIVVTKRNKEMQGIIGEMIKETGVPMIIVDRHNYTTLIKTAIQERSINVALMMTFPFIIPGEITAMPARGFINFHYGLLPQCRGPQPILWHLLNNDKETGVTVHKVDDGIDTGPIILREKITIDTDDTYGTLQSKLAHLGAKAAAQLLKILSYGTIVPALEQDESKAAYYQMPTAAELTIDWKKMTASQIIRLVNACNPWNKGAGTHMKDWFLGITAVELSGDCDEEAGMEAGTILACSKEDGLIVKTSDNKKLTISIVYTTEGFFPGYRLENFGIEAGMKFH